MHVRLTREDINRHTAALRRVEELEAWATGPNSYHRVCALGQLNSQFLVRVKCGYCCGPEDSGRHEEAIFRKYLDAAVSEAIAYWRKQADLTE